MWYLTHSLTHIPLCNFCLDSCDIPMSQRMVGVGFYVCSCFKLLFYIGHAIEWGIKISFVFNSGPLYGKNIGGDKSKFQKGIMWQNQLPLPTRLEGKFCVDVWWTTILERAQLPQPPSCCRLGSTTWCFIIRIRYHET